MDGLAIAVRFLHLAASVLALGAFAFVCLIAQPAAQRAGAAARENFRHFLQTQMRLVAGALAVVLATALVGLVLQAATMTGRPVSAVFSADTLASVLGTQYGHTFVLRMVLLLALAALVWRMRRTKASRPALLYAGFALAAALLAALAGAGHAVAGEGATLALQLASDALHLIAAGGWVGALLPLALWLAWCRRHESDWADAAAQDAARRFSWLGIATVCTLIVTGLYNGWTLVGDVAPLLGTTYGRLLLAKVGLLSVMLAFAAANLLSVRPRLLAADRNELPALFAKLRRNTIAEASLGATVLLIVAMLGVTPPARHVPPDWPFSFRWSWDVNKNLPEKRFPILIGKSYPEQRLSILTGAGLAGAALLPLLYGLLRRRYRVWALGLGLAGLGGGAALALPVLWVDAYPTTYWRPSVLYHAISVANAIHLYQQHCIVCHGVGGFGDGPAAAGLTPKPADLTAKHMGDHTVGDLFWWLSHGKPNTQMPGFADVLSEEERWDLINFLRTLSAAEQGRMMAPILEPQWLVAPDFSYRTFEGDGKSLKEHRGQNLVLLVLFTWPESKTRLQQLDAMKGALSAQGVEVLAVPRDASALPGTGSVAPSLTVAIDGSQEAFETYSMFRRSPSERGMRPDPPVPPHMEFLIDRQGYVRARWIAAENRGWSNTELLLHEIATLNTEKPSAPAPDDHVH